MRRLSGFTSALALALSLALAAPAAAVPGAVSPPAPTYPAPIKSGSQWYPIFANVIGAATTVAPSQNTARCAPFWAPFAYHTDSADIFVTTGGTGPLNFAIYTDAIDATTGKHQPQSPVTAPTVTFTVTGTGAATAALGTAGVGVPIAQGLNWVCTNDTTASDAVRFTAAILTSNYFSALVGAVSTNLANSSGPLTSLTVSQTAGTSGSNWPSLAGVAMTESSTTSVPTVGLRIATVP